MMYDIFHSGAPSYLKELFSLKVENRCAYNLRSDDNVNILNLPKVNIEIFRNSFSYLGASCRIIYKMLLVKIVLRSNANNMF